MHVTLLDSTLREGELFRVLPFNSKQNIVEHLIKANLKRIEVTLSYPPRTNVEESKKIVKKINESGSQAVIHARAYQEDLTILTNYDADACAFYIAVSSLHREHKLHGIGIEETILKLCEACDYAKRHGYKYIRATLEDFSRYYLEEGKNAVEQFMTYSRRLKEAGATVVSIPDTSGLLTPPQTREMISSLVNSPLPLSVHFHNDYGLASANTIEAALNGAAELQVSILGIGDRNGIADLYEVCSVLEDIYGVKTGINREYMSTLYSEFSKVSRIRIDWRHPLSLAARTVRAGVHQSLTVKRPDGYIPKNKLQYDFVKPLYRLNPFLSHKLIMNLLSERKVSLEQGKAKRIAEELASDLSNKGKQDLTALVEIINKEAGTNLTEKDVSDYFEPQRCYILLKLIPQFDVGEIISFLNGFEEVESVDEVYGDEDMVITATTWPKSDLINQIRQRFGESIVEIKVLVAD